MKYFPISVDLNRKPVLLVGNGATAARKAAQLYKAGANIKIIGCNLCKELQKLVDNKKIELINSIFKEKYLLKVFFVIAATNNNKLNEQIYNAANQHMKLVNVVDDQPKCSFIFPSIVDRSPLTIAISSDGKSPVLTRLIREKLEILLPNYIGNVANIAGKWRLKVKKHITIFKDRRKFWELLFNSNFINYVASNNLLLAEKSFNDHLYCTKKKSGELFLVGAGPGNPDLLTIRGLQIIQSADIVLYDNLVGNKILNLVRRDAELVCVGKCAGKVTFSQTEINKMIINLVHLGNKVVRLKGGDPFIFGRGGEELEAAKLANINFQVVPGITSAIGVAAYTGIPLTHRNYSQSVLFITGHSKKNINWSCLSKENQTIVIYMGTLQIEYISKQLILNGFCKNTAVAIISNGTLLNQKILVGSIKNISKLAKLLPRPTILIIGNVVNLHKQLNWFNNKLKTINIRSNIIHLD